VSQKPSQKSSRKTFPEVFRIAFSIELSYHVRVRTYKRGGVTMTKQEEPTNKIVKATEARDRLPQLLNSVYRGEGRVVVERSGIPVAAIVSPQDLAALDRLDAQRAELADVLAEMREAFKDVPQEEIEEETNKAVAEVRAQMRAEREQAAKAPSTP
jgi:prevent-host-death family protein